LTSDPVRLEIEAARKSRVEIVPVAAVPTCIGVYFATHGLVAGDLEAFVERNAEPALALTMPEKPDELDDGLLTASERSILAWPISLNPRRNAVTIGTNGSRAPPLRNPITGIAAACGGLRSVPDCRTQII
jgi:hypothetical protein